MVSGETIKVIIIDDHCLVVDGLISRFEVIDDIEVVGSGNSGLEAIELVEKEHPDVVLMDLDMPKMNGLEATRRLQADYPEVRILILSMHDKREYIVQLMEAGASGYVLKDVSCDELVEAIRNIYHHNTHFSSGVTQSLFHSSAESHLTEREMGVLKLLAEGSNNKQIARSLDLSVRTVEKHRQNIKSKLNIKTTSGLIRYAIEQKMGGFE